MSRWKNIKSAPTDGTPIIGGYYDVNPRLRWAGEIFYENDGDRGWYAANTHWTDYAGTALYPNRWQPMPAKPSA